MGLCKKTDAFVNMLWDDQERSSWNAKQIVSKGQQELGGLGGEEEYRNFAHDVTGRLYYSGEPEDIGGPEWAQRLHRMVDELEEWQNLKRTCAMNGLASGVAAEAVLSALGSWSQNDPDMRRAIRKAAREAQEEVDTCMSVLSGLGEALGVSIAGSAPGLDADPSDLQALRELWQKAKANPRLSKMLQMAGRALRVADMKPKTSISGAVGEYHGVERGSDVQRLLPGELALLRNTSRPVRLHALLRVVEKQALQYGMRGKEVRGKGELVILVDQSGSMSKGDRDPWAKAVTLAAVARAGQEKRVVHIVPFSGITHPEYHGLPREGDPAELLSVILREPSGGTSFDDAVLRAIELVAGGQARNADVILITDGSDVLDPEIEKQAQALTRKMGVSWYIIGVGEAAAVCPDRLGGIATSPILLVSNTRDFETVACAINTSSGVSPTCP